MLLLTAPGQADPGADSGPDQKATAQKPAPKNGTAKDVTVKKPASQKTAPAKKKPAAPAATKQAPLPTSVKMPEAGPVKARELWTLAGKLQGLPVVPDGESLGEVSIDVPEELAGQKLDREGLAVFLAAHRVYLFAHQEADGRRVLIATSNPRWSPESATRLYSRSFPVRSRRFEEIADEVARYIETKNRLAPAGQPPSTSAADPRTRQIFVRSASQRTIAGVDEIIQRWEAPDPSSAHLYVFEPRYRTADELVEEVEKGLGDAEAKRVSLVVPARKNALWIRTHEDLYRKVERILKAADTPGKRKSSVREHPPGPPPSRKPPSQKLRREPDPADAPIDADEPDGDVEDQEGVPKPESELTEAGAPRR